MTSDHKEALKIAQRKFRESKGEDYRKKENENRKRRREEMTEADLERERLRDRERKKKKREDTAAANAQLCTTSPQAFGKALAKVERALPVNPAVKKLVLEQLLVKYSSASSEVQLADRNRPDYSIVTNVFLRDDISRQAPGRRDFTRDENTKEKVQSRHMLYVLREAFGIFKVLYPTFSLSLSKFCSLRPFFVKKLAEMPHNVCVCVYHANMALLVEGIQTACPEFPSNVTSTFVCNEQSSKCMFDECDACGISTFEAITNGILSSMNEEDINNVVEYRQWEKAKKVPCTAPSLHGLLEVMKGKLSHFLRHTLVKRRQSDLFQEMLERITVEMDLVLIQMDYSENFAVKDQDEIQAAHWMNHQISIFTVVAWCGASKRSFAFVTDNMVHDKEAVFHFLDKLVDMLSLYEKKEIVIFTDGAASQFKSNYVVTATSKLAATLLIPISWHYFATSHGKGAVDGIGGEVKRMVWNEILSRRVTVQSAADFVSALAGKEMKTEVVLVPSTAIEEGKVANRFSPMIKVPHIQSIHQVFFQPDGLVEVAICNKEARSRVTQRMAEEIVPPAEIIELEAVHFAPGVVVVATFQENHRIKKYLGQVLVVENVDLHIKFLRSRGKKVFQFPGEEDIAWHRRDACVVCEEQPICNNKGQFVFTSPPF